MIGSWISLKGREEFGLDWVEIAWDGDPGLLMDGGTNQSLDGAEGLGGLLCLSLLALAFTGAPSLDGYIPFPFLLRCKIACINSYINPDSHQYLYVYLISTFEVLAFMIPYLHIPLRFGSLVC